MTEISSTPSSQDTKDLLVSSKSPEILTRIKELSEAFGYNYLTVESSGDIPPLFEQNKFRFIVLDSSSSNNQNEVVGDLQGVRYFEPTAPILVIFPKRFDSATLPWIRKSGANFVISETDFLDYPKFDFFVNQHLGSDYLPVKQGDFELGTRIEIPLYYFMPINRKYVPLISAGTNLDQSRLDKIQKIGEVYIRRQDVNTFNSYLQANQDLSAKGLIRRCRVQFNEFRGAYLDLINHLTEVTDSPSYDEGKKLLERIQQMSQNLISMLMSASSVFEVINQSVEGEYNSLDRSPERAAIVGYFSVMASIGNTEKAMLATLLSDVGLLSLPVKTLNYFRAHGYFPADETMKKAYEQHPQYSINFAAQKKILLDPIVRDSILYSHSRQDEQGFPVVRAARIPQEAQLLHFVQKLDDRCQVRWGKPRITYTEELAQMLNEPSVFEVLSAEIAASLKKSVL